MTDDSVVLDTNVLLSATAPARALHKNATRALNEWPKRGTRLCSTHRVTRILTEGTEDFARFESYVDVLSLEDA